MKFAFLQHEFFLLHDHLHTKSLCPTFLNNYVKLPVLLLTDTFQLNFKFSSFIHCFNYSFIISKYSWHSIDYLPPICVSKSLIIFFYDAMNIGNSLHNIRKFIAQRYGSLCTDYELKIFSFAFIVRMRR